MGPNRNEFGGVGELLRSAVKMQKWAVNFKLQFFPICTHLNLSKPDTDILNVKIR